ncbi:DsbA family protein [Corynebacterium uterequi]|uniref:Protein-disulfide isomerase n=1 Tax=Corynebacterium uterequi TaxID=1072256 RepID=A0A0G3HG97_9CORY|nr:thioredoxin domain-containing protein [Corynebacterium uterequi]AKK11770.1 protein-disulfide isomerase [Corynebacterium uterequi]
MSAKSRSVSDPNSKGSASFLWVIVAVLAIAAIVIGVVVWQSKGKAAEEVAAQRVELGFTPTFDGNDVRLAADNAKADAPEVSLYEDFSCHYCADLAEATDDQMLQEIRNGNLVVTVNPLTFLDGVNAQNEPNIGHSAAAAAATTALADMGEFDAWWTLRAVLMDKQAEIYNQWSDEDFAEAAKAAGASDEAAEAIKAGKYYDQAVETAKKNAKELEDQTGSVSSPRVLLDGKDVQVSSTDEWIDAVLK